MATKFPLYEMKDGTTRLGAEYFNPILKDLDSRVDAFEQQRNIIDQAIQELQEFGLDRIDATIIPVLEAAQQALTEAQAQVEQLTQMIADADIPALLAAQTATVQGLLTAQQTQVDDTLSALQTQLNDTEAIAYAGL